MPELPEVENIRRGLRRKILGQKILDIAVYKPKLISGKGNLRRASWRKQREFIAGLRGEKILDIARRAKNLIFYLSRGKILLAHLKMSGQLIYAPHDKRHEGDWRNQQNQHTRIVFKLSRGTLFYNDQRMFGYVLYCPNAEKFEKENHFMKIGPEPFSPAFTPEYLRSALRDKKGKLKGVLMGQEVVAGLGNIYCDEICFRAGIRPQRAANSLSAAETKKLHAAILIVLKRAIRLGGSSVDDYRRADGTKGKYAREHMVYGRGGEPCLVCGKILQSAKINSRTTVFCGRCQR